MRIAIIEDDPAQGEQLLMWLKQAGHHGHVFAAATPFLQNFRRESYDLMVLDWNLPDLTGPEILAQVREHNTTTPVLFVTSRDSEQDIVTALQNGADDYMIKPVRREETLARIHALLRRSQPRTDDAELLDCAPYSVDLRRRAISRHGEDISLTEKEFDLALFLFRHQDQLLSRGHILESVWGISAELNTRTVDTHISNLRRKLALGPANGWRLSSIYQYGYRLEAMNTAIKDPA